MKKDYCVRVMKTEDVSQVVAIEADTFSMPWSKDDFNKALNDPHNIYVIVEKEQEILGYCGLWSVLDEGQITNVAIKKNTQGCGLGYMIMKELIHLGEEKGLTAFTLEVREGNIPARALYEKLGFESAGVRPNFYDKPKENAVIMWKYQKM
ncbi:MAG: ribosomal protein S18-alanine N-acetyltransferase [bacterium]|nr:ribosomal protein S18-alanine N-acetyltransferase [bacterium]